MELCRHFRDSEKNLAHHISASLQLGCSIKINSIEISEALVLGKFCAERHEAQDAGQTLTCPFCFYPCQKSWPQHCFWHGRMHLQASYSRAMKYQRFISNIEVAADQPAAILTGAVETLPSCFFEGMTALLVYRSKAVMKSAGIAVLAVLLPCFLNAQDVAEVPNAPLPQMDITGALPEPAHYTPPTASARWQYLYQNGFAPGALITSALGAGVNQATNDVPEWGQGAEGYGRRVGWVALNAAAQSTIESGFALALHEDTIYYRCACSGIWRRSAHALGSQLTARRPDGSRTLSLARPIGAFGGSLVLVPILPDRFNYEGDGLRNGTWSYGIGFGLNIVREFWPDVKRSFIHTR